MRRVDIEGMVIWTVPVTSHTDKRPNWNKTVSTGDTMAAAPPTQARRARVRRLVNVHEAPWLRYVS